jgi:small-conductance mechanosensitive channel
VLRHVHVALFGTDHAATTLTGSCGGSPGIACRVIWDLTHNGQLASVTTNFLAGPVHLALRVAYVLALAFIIRAVLHRLINRITERAANSLLPQLRGGVTVSLLPSRLRIRRRRRRAESNGNGAEVAGNGAEVADSTDVADTVGAAAAAGGATVTGPAAEALGIRAAQTDAAADTTVAGEARDTAVVDASAPEIAAAAANAERALVDERRHQRVRALGSILRSAASVTVLGIAGVVVLGDLGINLAPLLASAGVVGIAIGFGAQNMVRDYLAGISMLLEDQYGVGDVITVGDATGTVESVTLRITRMRDVNGIVWHVRNGTIEQVGNESQGWARAVIDFPVPYAADLATIRTILSDTALTFWNDPTWRAVMLEEPEVWGAQEVSSAEVTMRIVVKTAPLRQWEVEREMRARVKATLDAAGIAPAAEDAGAT